MAGKYGANAGPTKVHSYWSASGGILTFYRDNASTQVAFGESGTGLDVKFYGGTASADILWDESENTLEVSSGATVTFAGNLGFYGVTATAQQSYSTVIQNVVAALVNLGLMASA